MAMVKYDRFTSFNSKKMETGWTVIIVILCILLIGLLAYAMIRRNYNSQISKISSNTEMENYVPKDDIYDD